MSLLHYRRRAGPGASPVPVPAKRGIKKLPSQQGTGVILPAVPPTLTSRRQSSRPLSPITVGPGRPYYVASKDDRSNRRLGGDLQSFCSTGSHQTPALCWTPNDLLLPVYAL